MEQTQSELDDGVVSMNGHKPPEPELEHFTDLGNVRRLVQRHGNDLRYSVARRTWHVWDGKHWSPDATKEAMRRAKDTVRAMYFDASDLAARASLLANEEERKRLGARAEMLMSYALRCEARSKLEAMLELAQSEVGISVLLSDLDAEPWRLTTQNCTLDLRTGTPYAFDRANLSTRITPTRYNPYARDARWEQFLEDTLPDEDVRRYVQKALGYSLTGTGAEGGIFLPYGPTHTGKTTLLEAVKAALGTYAVGMDVSTLTGRAPNAGAPRSDLVNLFGARVVVSTEVPAGVKLDEALIKKLTGGDTLVYRTLYQTEHESEGTFVIWLGSNHRPSVRDDDDAVWERVRQIPFVQQHNGAAKDKTLRPYLQTEARIAVLAWLVEGARMYVEEGLEPPDLSAIADDSVDVVTLAPC